MNVQSQPLSAICLRRTPAGQSLQNANIREANVKFIGASILA